MKSVKAKSSKFINESNLLHERFEWQEGFDVFSYSQSQINNVINYIQNQVEHHKIQSFKEEYSSLLIKYQIPYKEEYLFHELI